MAPRAPLDVRLLAAHVQTTITHAGPGPVLADLNVAAVPHAVAVVSDVARAAGVVPVLVREVGDVARRPGQLQHQHVALLVTSADNFQMAADLVKWLAVRSPRGHVVFRFRISEARPPLPRRGVVSSVAEDDDRRLRRLIADVEFERASAWLAALDVEAQLHGRPHRDATVFAATWLRIWQGRLEEAERWCRRGHHADQRRLMGALVAWAQCRERTYAEPVAGAKWRATGVDPECADWLRIDQHLASGEVERARAMLAHCAARPAASRLVSLARAQLAALMARQYPARRATPSVVVSSAAGLARWHYGATVMNLLPAVPTLLQLLAEADDGVSALRGAARWAREQTGAAGVAFVDGDGRLAAADGWSGHVPSPDDRRLAAQVGVTERHPRGLVTLVVAPVRYAGGHIGGVLLLGSSERSTTLDEAAGTLAMLCAAALRLRLDERADRGPSRTVVPEILGDSPATAALRDAIVRAAPTPFAVLVEGESGTGKELVARALHRLSARRDRRLVAVNCAALSDELVEAELFGHTRGAFTGAVAPRTGLFEDAHGGTLFLDEVAELSARAQAKLLRVLQEREVRRVGENLPRAVDVRVVAASNRPLATGCAEGRFRDDLLFRLAVVRIRLAPLRERAEDIAPIVRSLWSRTMREVGKHAVMAPDAVARLAVHQWPGNVRELQNVVAGLAMVAPTRGRVLARHVDLVLASSGASRHAPPMSLARARRTCERQTVAAALARHAGRRSAAARELGLTRQGLAKIIRRLDIGDTAIEGVA